MVSDKERKMVHVMELEDREKSDCKQWRHHLFAFFFILLALGVTLLRGTEKEPSLVGIKTCGTYDNLTLASFLTFSVLMAIC